MWTKRNAPAWAKGVKLPVACDIDAMISARGGDKLPNVKHNALSLMGLVRSNARRGKRSLRQALLEVANSEHSTNPITRRAFFHRCALRLPV